MTTSTRPDPIRHPADRPAPSPWATVAAQRSVLFVVHNVTTLNRLLDVMEVFASDLRVAGVVTSQLSDPFADDLPEKVASLGLAALPWELAVQREFDLIVTASSHGDLDALRGPIVRLPHGNGHAKYAPGQVPGVPGQVPGVGGAVPGAGGEVPGASGPVPAPRGAFGLSAPWLLRAGRPIADAVLLSHGEQLDRLVRQVPAAAGTAVVIGDPCYDRLVASLSRRREYRRALGVTGPRTVVLISSTWGPRGLLGVHPEIVARAAAELPRESFTTVVVAHPNIWSWHGAFQLRAWFADARRAGVVLIPPLQGWQAAVVAADCVIGDHGSVTAYAAGLGAGILLGTFPDDDVVPGTAVGVLGRLAPRWDPRADLRPQIAAATERAGGAATENTDGAATESTDGAYGAVRDLLTDRPGRAMEELRRVAYRLLGLDPPPGAARPRPYDLTGLASS